jgi:hypothetical protein
MLLYKTTPVCQEAFKRTLYDLNLLASFRMYIIRSNTRLHKF